jgi:hypothetical protein
MMLTTIDLTAAIEAAVRAPSLHNSQPWRFVRHGTAIEVRIDPRRRLPATDPTGWAARLAGGAALFNLRLALAVQGWQPAVRICPQPADPDLLATLADGRHRPASPAQQQLAAAIWHRRSHRAPFWPDPVPAQARSRLVTAAREEGGWLELLVGPGPANAVTELARAADRLLMRDPGYRAELQSWIRTGDAADPDGVPADPPGGGPGGGRPGGGRPADGGRRQARTGQAAMPPDGVTADAAGPAPQPNDLLPARPYSGLPARGGRDDGANPLIAVLGTAGDTPGDQVIAGQVLQRVLLTATDDGLATSMVSQPIEVPGIREQLRLALGQYGTPQMLLRIGYGVAGAITGRRPVHEVVDQPTAIDQPGPGARPKSRA